MQWSRKLSQIQGEVLNRIKDFDWSHTLKRISWKSPKVIGTLSVSLILLGGVTYNLTTTTAAAAVLINGHQVGLVRDAATAQSLVNSILEEKGQPYGIVAKTHDVITYENLRVRPAVYLESALDETSLANDITCYVDGYKLEADGSVIAVLPTKEDADKVLKEYQDHYSKPSSENKVTSISFAEKVNVEKAEVSPDQIKPVDQAYKVLLDGKITTKSYTVQPNDSWWLIARKNNMLTDEVLAGNPGATKNSTLKPGEVIKLVDSTPFLTVVSEGTYSGSEAIPYDVVAKLDPNLGYGSTKVITQGSNGSKLVTYSYVRKNGIDVTKKVLAENVTKEPVDQVIAKGPGNVTVAYAVSRGSSNGDSSLVGRALSLEGTPYVFGGSSRSGFDCSGFTKYVYANSGISLPRTSYAQFASGNPVSKNDLRPGDLVFFTTYTSGASHVGIYMGGGRFIHASNPNSGIEVSSLSDSFYASRYLGARRYN
ncbi:cell wall-associated hydrolase, invasion-associated protein [Desulfosporosinus acidiphilus SJ4]|uniref:Cell wall-associated hydrolase, invasion-associated protein n=1 Tax=Desulfosporosinus acidiphilus (strain DSM 22704 / JCM 16185 / SJ4) TaxID=646529 RepID=I4D4H9_DESAJ|nr:C40 family peptidase [Desulfosporosinus acidiphilus]AFM40703.1 cell wall-associated hydrolase, invasion-associated protein [Desulfosporosinus acidiphilus SJ4]